MLNSKRMTSDGPLDLIDDRDSDDDMIGNKQSYKQLGRNLPGTKVNFGRPIARSKALQLAPTGRTFAAATTEGLLIYSIDDNLIYDPVDIAIDVTPEVGSSDQHFRLLSSLQLVLTSWFGAWQFCVTPIVNNT